MKQRKLDLLMIVIVLLAASLLWIFLRPGETGACATVTIHGTETARYPLSQNVTVTLGDNEAYNVLTISDGKVSIIDANCGDHTCVHTGRISREGEQIICLPHELVVEIVGGEQSDLDGATH